MYKRRSRIFTPHFDSLMGVEASGLRSWLSAWWIGMLVKTRWGGVRIFDARGIQHIGLLHIPEHCKQPNSSSHALFMTLYLSRHTLAARDYAAIRKALNQSVLLLQLSPGMPA
jgi:hypothetical protein